MTSRSYPSLVVLLAVLIVGGCGRSLNEQIDLVGVDPTPALSNEATSIPRNEQPPMQALSRAHWPVVTVEIPTHQVEHNHAYVQSRYLGQTTSRQLGEYPTVRTALDTPPDLNVNAFGEFFLGAGESAWVLVSSPIRLFLPGRQPLSVDRSPAGGFQRITPVVDRSRALDTCPPAAESPVGANESTEEEPESE